MKRAAILIGALSLLLSPTVVFAEVHVQVSNNEGSSQVNVHSQTSGSSTVCQNSNCTTTGGDNTSTVCINGSCTTTNEDVQYNSEDGSTKVEVHNSGAKDEITPTIIEKKATLTPEPTATPDPEIENNIKKVEEKVEEINNHVKTRAKDNDGAIATFIQSELNSLQNLISSLFN